MINRNGKTIVALIAIIAIAAVALSIGYAAYAAGWKGRIVEPAYEQTAAAVCTGGGVSGVCDEEEECPDPDNPNCQECQ